jgi:hypothetical protein
MFFTLHYKVNSGKRRFAGETKSFPLGKILAPLAQTQIALTSGPLPQERMNHSPLASEAGRIDPVHGVHSRIYFF